MPSCVPIRQIRDTKNFSEMVEGSKEPVIVTKDGRCSFVSMAPETYDAMRLEASRARLYQAILASEEDVRAGRLVDAEESDRIIRERYGL